ncbi:hypothetical protein [Litchfieldia salsa]|uniref:Uncharacterized protein n=1 Tax=Litchfieldia salsa TaxID=930152 RepID=A0A1H0VNI8_9BACI|nr:hypothetical protein [Litchfieldia salsa]SDP80152.1 hypothetical protein SAMN05216565_107111 [Litchfieldia salsa]
MPEYTTFLNDARTAQFWLWVKWLMFFVAPVIMIFIATDVVGMTLKMIRKIVGSSEKKRDDDDDYDVYRY